MIVPRFEPEVDLRPAERIFRTVVPPDGCLLCDCCFLNRPPDSEIF